MSAASVKRWDRSAAASRSSAMSSSSLPASQLNDSPTSRISSGSLTSTRASRSPAPSCLAVEARSLIGRTRRSTQPIGHPDRDGNEQHAKQRQKEPRLDHTVAERLVGDEYVDNCRARKSYDGKGVFPTTFDNSGDRGLSLDGDRARGCPDRSSALRGQTRPEDTTMVPGSSGPRADSMAPASSFRLTVRARSAAVDCAVRSASSRARSPACRRTRRPSGMRSEMTTRAVVARLRRASRRLTRWDRPV